MPFSKNVKTGRAEIKFEWFDSFIILGPGIHNDTACEFLIKTLIF